MELMRINELAKKLNISARAIRFYEQNGMITPTRHPNNNYRMFSEQDARRLQTIISLREVGMSIEEIKSSLEELDQGEQEGVLYALELQRSMMFSQLVELINNIQTTDKMISRLKEKEPLAWEDIFEWTNGLKQLSDLRANWRDHWNFDRQASFHDELVFHPKAEFNQHPAYSQALQTVVDWVKPRQGEKGLDIGTGTGNLAGRFLAKGITMAGIDQSKEMLKQCNGKFPEMETKLGNFLAIPYLDRSFDFVVTSYALHHLTEEQKLLALEEMRRVLKPHGRICIVDLMFEHAKNREAYYRTLEQEGKQEIIALIEDEFYADRSKLLAWLDDHGYVTKAQQLHDILHIVYAVPIALPV